MRKAVAIEGVEMPDGRSIAKGALTCDDEKIPVTVGYDHQIVGIGTDMQRDDETGEVSFEIEFLTNREHFEQASDLYDVRFYIQPFEADPSDHMAWVRGEKVTIISGRIRELMMHPSPTIPKGMLGMGAS